MEKGSGIRLYIDRLIYENYFDFLDYLRGGLNITPIVGIDFTASNRDPDDP